MDKFERSVLKIMDQRQDQFASIAQQLLTTGLTSAAPSVSIATAITAASVGVSVAKGISEVRDLKHYMLSGIDGSVDSTYKQLPGFTALLEWREREISAIEAAEIKQMLESNGVLQSLQVNIDKLGFVPGLESVSQSQTSGTPKVVQAEQKEQIGVQPFVFNELKQEATSENSNNVLMAPVNSSSGSYNIDLGSSKRYRRQITSLLTDLDKANHTSYEQQIEASATRISEATGERMRGLIRSGIISPVTSAVVTYAANEMIEWVNTELFGRRELDKLKMMADSLQISGVSAGENYGNDSKQEIDKTFLSNRADDVIEFIQKYEKFAQEYPTLAEYGLQALSLGLKGVYTLATGGTGLFALAANEAKGMLFSAVTADAMQKVVDISIEKTQKQLLEYDNTLTDHQAQALASALVVGTALTISSAQDVRSYANVIKNIGKPKVTNANPLHLESSNKSEGVGGSTTSKKAERIVNCTKSESPVWKEFKSYKKGIKTNGETGSKVKYYQWDYLHNEIEVYGPGGKQHLGAMDPRTGEFTKPPKLGRNISKLIN